MWHNDFATFVLGICRKPINAYAHIEIVVAFLVVKNFGFLVIARYHTIRISRKLEEIFLSASRSFLNQNFRNQTVGKPKFKGQHFRVNPKNFNDYFHFSGKVQEVGGIYVLQFSSKSEFMCRVMTKKLT